MRALKQAFLVILLMIVVIIIVQNSQPTTFRFLNWSYQVSQLLLVVVVLAIGFLSGFVVAKLPRGHKDDDEPVEPIRR